PLTGEDEAAPAPLLETARVDEVARDDVGANAAVRLATDVPATLVVGPEHRRIRGRRADGERCDGVARARVAAVVRAARHRSSDLARRECRVRRDVRRT